MQAANSHLHIRSMPSNSEDLTLALHVPASQHITSHHITTLDLLPVLWRLRRVCLSMSLMLIEYKREHQGRVNKYMYLTYVTTYTAGEQCFVFRVSGSAVSSPSGVGAEPRPTKDFLAFCATRLPLLAPQYTLLYLQLCLELFMPILLVHIFTILRIFIWGHRLS